MSRPRRAATPHVAVLVVLAGAAAATIPSACGARTGLDIPLPDPPPPACETFEDCDGAEDLCNPVGCELEEKVRPEDGRRYLVGTCVTLEPVDCDDGDDCTIDTCSPGSGRCGHAPASIDADGDGFNGPRAGFTAWDPGSCGDDCDDTSDRAYPGALEVCDGVDNDCNRIVDDGATWLPLDLEPLRLSDDGTAPAEVGGVSWSGDEWLTFYSMERETGSTVVRTRLGADGAEIAPTDVRVSERNSDTFAGPVLWIGDRYATAWQDRGNDDFEIYFGLFAPNGDKITPDTRLSFGADFSLYPDVAWTGQEHVVVWQDRRAGFFEIWGQRLDRDGQPIGGEVPIASAPPNEAEEPVLRATTLGTGMVFGLGTPADRRIAFTVLEPDLSRRFEPVLLTDGTSQARFQTLAANLDEYVVMWSDASAERTGIWGAVLDQQGALLVPPRRVIDPGPGNFARNPTVRALGDRVILVYSDTRDADDFELWAKLLDARLEPLEEERRITFAPGASTNPGAAFGPDGNLGVLFRDDRLGEQHVWFTRLGCAVSQLP